ncbi:Protein of unknown function [Pyronema omphalodes CBS 100304]|uniref:Uncharacterized protein n=1 Tax=Pyronema omphalodes (strain CBS 100304) TaxID=1076935 RepID=U4L698_PYROM|nr:Protein of unknown function [Pyronema omphalodes CBS 100304]
MVQPRRRSSPPEDPFADPPAVPDRSVVSQHHQPRSSFSSAGHSDSGDRDYGDHDYHARARLVENTAALVSVSSPYSGDKGKHKWDDPRHTHRLGSRAIASCSSAAKNLRGHASSLTAALKPTSSATKAIAASETAARQRDAERKLEAQKQEDKLQQ